MCMVPKRQALSTATPHHTRRVGYRILLFCPSSVCGGTIFKLRIITPKYTHTQNAEETKNSEHEACVCVFKNEAYVEQHKSSQQ